MPVKEKLIYRAATSTYFLRFSQLDPSGLEIQDDLIVRPLRLPLDPLLKIIVVILQTVDLGQQGLKECHGLEQQGLVPGLRRGGHQSLETRFCVRDLLFAEVLVQLEDVLVRGAAGVAAGVVRRLLQTQ